MELNTIVQSDALAFLRGLPDGCVDLILTSPPYDNLRKYNGYSFEFEPIAQESYRVLKQGGVLVWVVGDATVNGSETLTSFRQALYFTDVVGFRMHDTMIYRKTGITFPEVNRYYPQFEYMFVLSKGKPATTNLQTQRNKYAGESTYGNKTSREVDGSLTNKGKRITKEFGIMGNVWEFATGYGNSSSDPASFTHPATFPEKLAERHIRTWTNEGDTVLDFFMGSGTTAKMARNLKRNYIGCDISEEYVLIARDRLRLPFEARHTPQNDDVSDLPMFAKQAAANDE